MCLLYHRNIINQMKEGICYMGERLCPCNDFMPNLFQQWHHIFDNLRRYSIKTDL